jgi:hypothetical protein
MKKLYNNGLSNMVGSILLTAIVTTAMVSVILLSSQNATESIEKNNEYNKAHDKLMEEMGNFYDVILNQKAKGFFSDKLKAVWFYPRDHTTDVEKQPECQVYIDGPAGDVVTVYFYYVNPTEYSSAELASDNFVIKTKTVQRDTVVSLTYDLATEPNTRYYWAVALCYPGEAPASIAFLSFTTRDYPPVT